MNCQVNIKCLDIGQVNNVVTLYKEMYRIAQKFDKEKLLTNGACTKP